MKDVRIKTGFMAILIIVTTPVVLWYMAPAYPPRFGDFETTLANLGQIFGLVGAVLLSLNFILSTRLKFLEKLFRGLNDVYIKHALFGKIAFALLLFHPLLLLTKYTEGSFSEAVSFLLPGDAWDINFGTFGLGVMTVLIALTLYLRPRYDIWKITHKFFGLALIFAGLHIYLVPSDVSTYLPLRIYMISLIALGFLAYTYKTLLNWLLAPKMIFEVTDVKTLNKNVTQISFKTQKPFVYKAGQFCFVSFDDPDMEAESHPYSFVSAPHENLVKLAIKNLGDHTAKVGKLHTGTIAKVEGPFGIFNYENAYYKNQIWIAGGIGITPFVSMAEDLLHRDADYEVDIFYAVNEEEDAVYLGRLQEIARLIPQKFRVHVNYLVRDGLLTTEKIMDKVGDFDSKNIFICGPPKMMATIRDDLSKLGVLKNAIRSEEFSL